MNENDAVRSKKEKTVSIPLLFADHEASESIARNLISKHHHELADAHFKFLCRNKAAMAGGEKVPGSIKKASPMEKHVCGGECDYIMTVSLDVWNDLSPNQRTALIDHLLTRCVAQEDPKTGEMKYKVRPPQVQEFPEIAERYGTWNDGLVELNACLRDK
jgi:Putative phage metallopeptidase